MKKKKNFLLILAIISFFILVGAVSETYAKYINATEGKTDLAIARWRILVNNQDIRNNPEISETLTPTIIENEPIKPVVIAPTS